MSTLKTIKTSLLTASFCSELAAFRSKLDPQQYSFDFVDAPFDSPPAAGVDVFFDPPNFTFWRGTAPSAIKDAHIWLRALLDRQGPYDGLIGFSQGCALISSFILYHSRDRPQEPLPFKSAVFICGGVPLTALEDLGCPISAEAWDINDRTSRNLREKAGFLATEIKAIIAGGLKAPRQGRWDRTDTLAHDPLADFPADRTNVFGLDFSQFPPGLRIDIPTLHVYGSKDPRYPSAMQLVHFADEANRRVYDHAGGHDIPRTSVTSERIAELLEWLEGRVRG